MKVFITILFIILFVNYSYGKDDDYIGKISNIIEFEIDAPNKDIYALVVINGERQIILIPLKYACYIKMGQRVSYTTDSKNRHYLDWFGRDKK